MGNKYRIREVKFADDHTEYFPEVLVEARQFVAPCDEHWEDISEMFMRITRRGYDYMVKAFECIESHKKGLTTARCTIIETITHEIK